MVRCAYAHKIAEPKWVVRGDYRRTLVIDLDDEKVQVNLQELNGTNFDFSQIGGHHVWFTIRDKVIATLTSKQNS